MKPNNDYGAIQRQHAAGILAQVFGDEWASIDSPTQTLVCVDYLDAANDGGMSAREYARNIGPGNLASYGACQLIRANDARRTWEAE